MVVTHPTFLGHITHYCESLMPFYILYGLVLLLKDDFHHIKRLWYDFIDGILGGVQNFQSDPYLNGTIYCNV